MKIVSLQLVLVSSRSRYGAVTQVGHCTATLRRTADPRQTVISDSRAARVVGRPLKVEVHTVGKTRSRNCLGVHYSRSRNIDRAELYLPDRVTGFPALTYMRDTTWLRTTADNSVPAPSAVTLHIKFAIEKRNVVSRM